MWAQWSPARLTGEGQFSRPLAAIVFLLYAVATLYVGIHHEPWRDEADPWLAARDMSFAEAIPHWTANEGSPALWFTLLKILTVPGLPYESLALLHLVLAWAAAAVLLLDSPFTWPTRILALASYYFAYEYAIIARSYVLTVLLSFLAAAWYRQRDSRPIRYAIVIALLFNTNVHGAILAAILVLLFAIERPRSRSAIAVMIAGAIVAALQLRPAADAPFPHVLRETRLADAWTALGSAFFPAVPFWIAGAAGLAVTLLIALSLRRSRALLFLAASVTLLELLYVFVWFGGYRHAGLLLLAVILAVWLAREVPADGISRSAAIALNVSLVVLALFVIRMGYADVKMNFSGAKEMGTFIERNGLDRYEIAAHDFFRCEAILPYVPGKQVWYAALGRYGTYMHWNRDEQIGLDMPYDAAVGRAIQHFAPKHQPWLMLLNRPIAPPRTPAFREIYATRGFVYRHPDERYWLYVWTGDQRSTR